jgi:chymotrypsin-like protease
MWLYTYASVKDRLKVVFCSFLLLPTDSLNNFYILLSPLHFSGWGRTVGGGYGADILQQAILPVASHQDCARVNNYLIPVDERTMICAGGQNAAGGCQGDSGGPFVCNEGGKWVLRGSVSWGHGWCRTDHYTVFARISTFIDWINQKKSGNINEANF